MNNPILNRSAPKRGIVVAMMIAIAIHWSGVAIASLGRKRAVGLIVEPSSVIGIDDRDEPSPPPEIPLAPQAQHAATEFRETPSLTTAQV
jgi:hypothetical protein